MCFLLVLFFLFSTNFQWHNNHYVNCPLVLSHSACALCVRSPSSNCLYALSFLNMSTVAVCSRFAVPVNELLIQIVENKMKTSTNTKSNRHRNNDSISKRLCTVQLIKDKSFCLFLSFFLLLPHLSSRTGTTKCDCPSSAQTPSRRQTQCRKVRSASCGWRPWLPADVSSSSKCVFSMQATRKKGKKLLTNTQSTELFFS